MHPGKLVGIPQAERTTLMRWSTVSMRRILAVVSVVPGLRWAVATLAVLVYDRDRDELPTTPSAGDSGAAPTRSG